MLRTLSERAIEMQNELYLCLIHCTKAFDSVKHQELIKLIEKLNVDGNALRIIRNVDHCHQHLICILRLYRGQSALYQRKSNKKLILKNKSQLFVGRMNSVNLSQFREASEKGV